ncbi:MAG: hypothetical protein AAFR35_12960 [Pseudomonadota bacterium]
MRRLLLLAFLLPGHAFADGILRTDYADLEPRLTARVDFEDHPRFMTPGQRHDEVIEADGARFGERLLGQRVQQSNGFDRLRGQPISPVAIAAGAPGENLSVTHYLLISNHLVGNAAPGYPDFKAGGEGSVAILFEREQSALGFRVAAEPQPKDSSVDQGWMTVTFYARDGHILDRIEVVLDWGRNGYGFETADNRPVIAAITIENQDPAGIAIDDVIFDTLDVTG